VAKVRVGINGFGRIGRILFRAGFEELEIVGINDLGGAQSAAHLLKYDSTHGTFPQEVKASDKSISVGGKEIPVSSERDPSKLPWKDWGVDIVLECTGAFKEKADFMKHVEAGANMFLFRRQLQEQITPSSTVLITSLLMLESTKWFRMPHAPRTACLL
jgi:glyceraldehyde 3-phosphate dehydrogenase